ncbi:MAG TPA: glutamine synthetase, partial [Thermohalobaculum sp.]|nr:glutamine synthetase [Thermohalobaculum sp.]
MTGMLTLKELGAAVDAGEIDTVLVCFPDMFGRLVGKRFHGRFFVDGGHE